MTAGTFRTKYNTTPAISMFELFSFFHTCTDFDYETYVIC